MFSNRERKTFTPALLRLLGRWPAWPAGFVRPQNIVLSRIKLQNYRAIQLQNYRNTELPNRALLWYQTTFPRPKGDLKESRIEKGHCDNEKVNGEESEAVSWAINGECST